MSNPILEKSLDEKIGENKKSRPTHGGRKPKQSRIIKPHAAQGKRQPAPKVSSSLPREIQSLARSRPVLRVKNIHPDLNGEDLSQLFDGVAPVEFVKFDPKKLDVAYVCFQSDFNRNNSVAISKFDGRQAMGQKLVVESATSLADRITAPSRYGSPRKPKLERKSNPGNELKKKMRTKKSIDDLDEELSAYMSGKSEKEIQDESRAGDLDKAMDNYWSASTDKETQQPHATGEIQKQPAETNSVADEMNVD